MPQTSVKKSNTLAHAMFKNRVAYAYIAPFFILFAVFSLFPILAGFGLSFYRWDGMSKMHFIGIDNSEKYNKIAIEHGVEFMRFGMKNSQYIDASKEAIKSGAKEIELLDEKAKPTGEKVSIEFATWRACSFAISALTQEAQAKKTWKLASPSDGYKY